MSCKDCKVANKEVGPRCKVCYRRYSASKAARLRKAKRAKQIAANLLLSSDGMKICTRCSRKRHLSEYGSSLEDGKGRQNEICDECLTKMYSHENRQSGLEVSYVEFRRRCYNLNSVARMRLARERNLPTRDVKLSDIEYIFKPQDLANLYTKQDGKCEYCKVSLNGRTMSADHATPISRKGGHAIDNIVLSCRDCNLLKATRTKEEFVAFLKEYVIRLLQVIDLSDKEPTG